MKRHERNKPPFWPSTSMLWVLFNRNHWTIHLISWFLTAHSMNYSFWDRVAWPGFLHHVERLSPTLDSVPLHFIFIRNNMSTWPFFNSHIQSFPWAYFHPIEEHQRTPGHSVLFLQLHLIFTGFNLTFRLFYLLAIYFLVIIFTVGLLFIIWFI